MMRDRRGTGHGYTTRRTVDGNGTSTHPPPDDAGGRRGRLRSRQGGPEAVRTSTRTSRSEEVPPAPPPPAPTSGETEPDELQRLADLHDSGALTDDEFAAAKAKILGI